MRRIKWEGLVEKNTFARTTCRDYSVCKTANNLDLDLWEAMNQLPEAVWLGGKY